MFVLGLDREDLAAVVGGCGSEGAQQIPLNAHGGCWGAVDDGGGGGGGGYQDNGGCHGGGGGWGEANDAGCHADADNGCHADADADADSDNGCHAGDDNDCHQADVHDDSDCHQGDAGGAGAAGSADVNASAANGGGAGGDGFHVEHYYDHRDFVSSAGENAAHAGPDDGAGGHDDGAGDHDASSPWATSIHDIHDVDAQHWNGGAIDHAHGDGGAGGGSYETSSPHTANGSTVDYGGYASSGNAGGGALR